jgi:hypothetical protein
MLDAKVVVPFVMIVQTTDMKKVAIWTDSKCSSVHQFANVTSYDCLALKSPIKSISVDC